MAQQTQFGNTTIGEPGAYSRITSGINNPPIALSYGSVLLIDTGLGQGYGGAAINGTLANGKSGIQVFSDIENFRNTVRGGMFWQAAKWLFRPSKDLNIKGISNLFFISAKTAIPAEIVYTFGDFSTSDSDSITDGGQIVLQVKNEGVVGNGVKTGTKLTRGYAGKMRVGVQDTNKFIIDFYAGTFTGLDADGEPYTDSPGAGIAEANSVPQLLCSSKEFDRMSVLLNWMQTNSTFNQYFKVKTSSITGSGIIDLLDYSVYSDYNLAFGGVETYNTSDLSKVLLNITDIDYSFILSDNYGSSAVSANNLAYKNYIHSGSNKYALAIFIGGGKDANYFESQSIVAGEYFDSEKIVVVHAGLKKNKITGAGYKEYDSFIKTAAVVGRIAGLPPQVPGTFKDLDMDADMHDMTENERLRALDKGVLHTKYEETFGQFIINQAINTKQQNDFMINVDGTSYEIQIMRIANQLNKIIVYNAKNTLLRDSAGVNRNTLSPVVIETWLKGLLEKLTATSTQDNLILGFQDILVKIVGDSYQINYGFIPNFPVNKICFTGIMLDPNI
jgi:hypothetical protein